MASQTVRGQTYHAGAATQSSQMEYSTSYAASAHVAGGHFTVSNSKACTYAPLPIQTSICETEWFKRRERFVEILYREMYWCFSCPCFCGGLGCVNCDVKPCCLGHFKFAGCESACQSDDFNDDEYGCTTFLTKCLCCMGTCHFPPRTTNFPTIACCDWRIGDEDYDYKGKFAEDSMLIAKTFLFCYCVCGGCGCTQANDAFAQTLVKFCCFKSHCFTTTMCPKDRDCAFDFCKCCCCMLAQTYPSCGGERDGIPGCAICNTALCCLPAEVYEAWGFSHEYHLTHPPEPLPPFDPGAGRKPVIGGIPPYPNLPEYKSPYRAGSPCRVGQIGSTYRYQY